MEATPRNDEHGPEPTPAGAVSQGPSAPPRKRSRVSFESFQLGPHKIRHSAKLRDNALATLQRRGVHEAREARALAEIQEDVLTNARCDAETNLTLRSRAAELSAAMGIGELSVLNHMSEAHMLVYSYPATLALVESVKITMKHAKVILSEGLCVDYRLRAEYEARCLDIAVQTSAGRLRTQAKLIAQELQPRSIDEMHALSASQRNIWVTERPDGMAELCAVLPAVMAYGIYDRVQNIAKAVKKEVASEEAAWAGAVPPTPEGFVGRGPTVAEELGITIADPTKLPANYADLEPDEQDEARARVQRVLAGREERSIGTYRADVFAELLLTGLLGGVGSSGENSTSTGRIAPGIKANISITIPVGGTATLDGYGPIDSTTARQFAAAEPGWDAVHLDADGEVLSTSRRHPTEAMKRVLRARDQHCRFPGCIVPTRSCEIDHTLEWAAGGPTEIWNLGHLCPKHHLLKHPDLAHQIQWKARQDPGGVFVWTSPTGAEYTDRPDHTLRRFGAS